MNSSTFTSLIVTYNSANDVLNLLADLHSHVPSNPIIVIDNASSDETVTSVQQQFPRVQLTRNSTNRGYARAVNQGFDQCDTEYVMLLNPDIRITSARPFFEMENYLKQFRQIAAAAPLQFKNGQKYQSLNFTWSYWTRNAFKVYLSLCLQHKQAFTEPIRVTFLNAGCLFLRRSAFEQVGRLNEKYFMYGEEPDLFLKFIRYGFECYLFPHLAVTHYRERSLMTVPPLQRLRIKVHALWNITDAFISGWAAILLDKLVMRKAQSIGEKW